MKTGYSAWFFTSVLAALGYIGAVLFYGHLLGFNTRTSLICPLCPHIDGAGDTLHKFMMRTFVLGTLNAFLVVGVGWFFRGLVAVARRATRN
jgi:hypothetical protein